MPANFGELFTAAARRARRVSARIDRGGRSGRRRPRSARGRAPECPRRRRGGLWRLTGPGWLRVLWFVPLARVGDVAGDRLRAAMGFEPLWEFQVLVVAWTIIVLAFWRVSGASTTGSTGSGRPTRPGGPLGPRRAHVEGLFPSQHRSQGDRDPVRGHDGVLLRRGRPHGDAHARRAGAARDAVRGHQHVQRALLGARVADDLPSSSRRSPAWGTTSSRS